MRYIQGDIFSTPAKTVVNTVNTVGVMGKGIALAFKQKYPEMYRSYRKACEDGSFSIGRLMLYYGPDYWVLSFPTKEHWRKPSKLEYIEAGLKKFVSTYAQKNISSIAFPHLGCGNGELAWDDVRPLMEAYLKKLPIDVYIYEGPAVHLLPEHRMQAVTVEWLRTHGKDMSFNGLIDDIKHESAMVPIRFEYEHAKVDASWNDGINFCNDEIQLTIDEDSLHELWDAIRDEGVVSVRDRDESASLTMSLLVHMGYMSPIKYSYTDAEALLNGYQLNMGLNRAFAIRKAV
jgi:O-acetyl-ADP-ribose deacetylase (regulator of RNase III)